MTATFKTKIIVTNLVYKLTLHLVIIETPEVVQTVPSFKNDSRKICVYFIN